VQQTAEILAKIRAHEERAQKFDAQRRQGVSAIGNANREQFTEYAGARERNDEGVKESGKAFERVVDDSLGNVDIQQQELEDGKRQADVEVQMLGETEGTMDKRMESGGKMIEEVSGDAKEKVSGNLTNRMNKVGSAVELGKIEEKAHEDETNAIKGMAEGQLKQEDGKIARMLEGEEAKLHNADDLGNRFTNRTEGDLKKIEEFVRVQIEEANDQKKQLQGEVQRSAGEVLKNVAKIAKAEMSGTHKGYTNAEELAAFLQAFRDTMEEVFQGEAFQSLKAIANADMLAARVGTDNSKYIWWMKLFKNEQKEYHNQVGKSLQDANAEEAIQRAMIEAGERAQEEDERKIQEALEHKTDSEMNRLGNDAGMSNLTGSMGKSAAAMRSMQLSQGAANEAFMKGIDAALNSKSGQEMLRTKVKEKEMEELQASLHKAEGQMSGLEGMLGIIQTAAEKRVEEEKDAIDSRAKAFSRQLLDVGGGAAAEKPSIQGLVTMATELQNRHDALSERHAASQENLKNLVAQIQASTR